MAHPKRFSRTLMLVILLIGLAVRFHGLVWTLPYYFWGDETRLVMNGVTLHQTGSQNYQEALTIMSNYPPYRSWETALTRATMFTLFGEKAGRNSMLVLTGRMFSLLYALLTIAFLYQIGKRVTHYASVGLIMAAYFAVWGQTLIFGQRTLADGAGMMFFCGCVWLAVLAYQTQVARYLVISGVFGILAGLAKYNYLPILALPALVSLTFFVNSPRQLLLRVVLPSAFLAVPIIYFASQSISTDDLFYQFLNETAQLEGSLRNYSYQGFTPDSPEWQAAYEKYPPNPLIRLVINYQTVLAFIPPLAVGLMVLGIGISLFSPPPQIDTRLLGVLGVCSLCFLLAFSLFRLVEGRQLFGAMLLGLLFLAIAIQRIYQSSPVAAGIVLAALLLPMGKEAWVKNSEFTKPDTRVATVNWLLENAQDGAGVALENEPYEFWVTNGYEAPQAFNVTRTYRLFDKEPPVWENEGFYYLVADAGYAWRGGYYAGHEKQAFWDQYVEVVARFEGEAYAGPDRMILRAFRPQVKLDIMFGDIVDFYGYTLDSATLHAGATLRIKYFWWAKQATREDYIIFNHLVNVETGAVLAQMDRLAGHNGLKPSSQWERNEWLFDTFEIQLPADIPSGVYRLQMGLYRASDGLRLPVENASDGILPLQEITISE